jgi:hypothetical protein
MKAKAISGRQAMKSNERKISFWSAALLRVCGRKSSCSFLKASGKKERKMLGMKREEMIRRRLQTTLLECW